MNLPIIAGKDYTVQPPLGLQYIAANIKGDYEVMILDQVLESDFKKPLGDFMIVGMTTEKMQTVINALKPEVIGISCNFSYQFSFLKGAIAETRRRYPEVKIVIGGNHVTAYYQLGYPKLNVDAYILGEAEDAFNLFLKGEHIEGQIYQVADLDSLKFPARVGIERYFEVNKPHQTAFQMERGYRVVEMITSRGCPYNCIFCSVKNIWGRGCRLRSAENVLAEIEVLINDYQVDEVHFEDDNLLYNKERILKIFKGIEKYQGKLRWTCPNGVDLSKIDREVLEAMKRSGCYRITICPECMSDRILKFYRKPFNSKTIREKVRLIKEVGFEMIGYFIIGAPMETVQEIWETIKFAINEFDDFSLSFLAPYLGTDYYKFCKENDLFMEDLEKHDFINMQADAAGTIKREHISSGDLLSLGKMTNWLKKQKVKL